MKILTGIFLLCLSVGVVRGQTAQRVIGNPTLPSTCQSGNNPQVYIDTNATITAQFYICTSTNTWTAQGSAGSAAIWGNITGTLSNQTDLQSALNLKANLASPTFTGTVTIPIATISTSATIGGVAVPTISSSSVFTNKDLTSGTNTFPSSLVTTARTVSTTTPLGGGGALSSNLTLTCATCVTSAASLTSTQIATGAGSQGLQTPSAAATVDASGNMTATTVATGDGTVAGEVALYELVANGTNFVSFLAPDSVTTTQQLKLPAAANAASQVLLFGAPSSNVSTAAWSSIPYDVAVFYEGEPAASSVFRFVAATAFNSGASFAGTVCSASVAATAQTDFVLAVNGVTKATLRFAASGTTCSIVSGTTTSIAATDVITITSPGSPDATLANVAITIKGTLN